MKIIAIASVLFLASVGIVSAQNIVVNGTLTVQQDAFINTSSGNMTIDGNLTLGGTSSNTITYNGRSVSNLNMGDEQLIHLQNANIGEPFGVSSPYTPLTGTLTFFNNAVTGKVRIEAAATSDSNYTYTMPDVGASANFVMDEGNQTINGVKSFSAPIATTSGGTGTDSLPNGYLLLGNGMRAVTAGPAWDSMTSILTGNISGAASNVTGIVALANGGTGVTNASGVAQNAVFAGPSSGGAGAASWRILTVNDMPSLSGTYLPLAGGTMAGNINMNGNNINMGSGNFSSTGTISTTNSITASGSSGLIAGDATHKGNLQLNDGSAHTITMMPGAITSSFQIGIPGLANTTISSSNSTARMVLVESATGIGGQVLFFGPTSSTARTYWMPDQSDSMVTTAVLRNGVTGGTYISGTLTSLGLSGGGHVGTIATSLAQATAYTLPDPGAATATIAINTPAGVNSDITSLTGLTTALPVSEGGTGAATVAMANQFFANTTSGSAPRFRSIVPGDLPIATTTTLGVVQPDDTSIAISAGGVITAIGAPPTGTAGGDLTGTYPNPTIVDTAGNAIVTALNHATPTAPIGVAAGGTGVATLTSGELLLGNGTNAVTQLATADNGVLATNSSGVPSITPTPTLGVTGATTGTITLANNTSGSHTTTIAAGNATTAMTYTLPATAPSAGQVLSSDASGNLSWVNASSAGSGSGTLFGGTGAGNDLAVQDFNPDAQVEGGSAPDVTNNNIYIVPQTGTISNLYVALQTASGSGKSWTFTLEDVTSGANSLAVTLSNVTRGSNTGNNLNVTAGDSITMVVTDAGGTPANTAAVWSMGFAANGSGSSAYAAGQTPASSSLGYTTSSSTPKMSGIQDGTYIIKPTSTGKVLVTVCGNLSIDSKNNTAQAQIYYGSGTGPTAGTATTSYTAAGPVVQNEQTNGSGGATAPFSCTAYLSGLTHDGSTTYFVDLGISTNGGNVTVSNVSITATELP